MAKKRSTVAEGRVGNYIAPVDTAGMDEAMKSTMGFGRKPAPAEAPNPAGPSISQRIGGAVKTLTTGLTKPFEPTDQERIVDARIAYRKNSPSHVTSGNRGMNSTGNYKSPSTKSDSGH